LASGTELPHTPRTSTGTLGKLALANKRASGATLPPIAEAESAALDAAVGSTDSARVSAPGNIVQADGHGSSSLAFDWREQLASAKAHAHAAGGIAVVSTHGHDADLAAAAAALSQPPTPFTAALLSAAATAGTHPSPASPAPTAATSHRNGAEVPRPSGTGSGSGLAAAAGAGATAAQQPRDNDGASVTTAGSASSVVTTRGSRASLQPLAPAAKPVVTSLADLELIAVLGEGAFGLVRLVRHRATREVFALKQMQKARIVANNQQRNVMNEKRILSRLSHPYIIAFVGAFKDRDCLFLLCEYCPGGDLFGTLLRAGGVLPPASAGYYASVVTSVLDYLHSSGVV